MSALPTPVDVARRLMELGQLFDQATKEIAELDEAHVRARQKYTVEYARKFLTGTGAVENRKQQAVMDLADELLEAEIAEQLLRACRERIKTLDRQMEIARSVGATTRAEMAATNWTNP